MRRGTTPTIVFKLPFETTNIAAAYVTFEQNNTIKVNKELAQCECGVNKLTVNLTQQETLSFSECGDIRMQIRLRLSDGTAMASNIMKCFCDEILKDGAI